MEKYYTREEIRALAPHEVVSYAIKLCKEVRDTKHLLSQIDKNSIENMKEHSIIDPSGNMKLFYHTSYIFWLQYFYPLKCDIPW